MIGWNSRRSAVLATKGVCSSSQPLASQTGVRILQQGGNAADAAVAMAAVLNLTEPCSTGIGGDAFAIFYDAKTKKVHCLQGNGASSSQLSLDYLHSIGVGIGEGLKPWNPKCGLCVTVPGAAALWEDIVQEHGRLSLEEILAPAIDLAENGFPIAPVTAEHWAEGYLQGEEAYRVFRPNNEPVVAGQLFKNPDLANTFRSVATHGAKKGFYTGPIAEAIVEVVKEIGGVLTLEDLANHATAREEPISTVYKGVRIYQTPPPSHGLSVLLALNYIQAIEKIISSSNEEDVYTKEKFGFGNPNLAKRADPDVTHVVIESMRRAYADGLEYIADPRQTNVPLDVLLSQEYAQHRAQEISLTHSTPVKAGNIAFFTTGETVYFAVVDSEGNACSFINSNYAGFGSGASPKGTGFTLQNRGSNFSLQTGHANQVGPNKRPYHTIIPSLATYESDGSLFGVFGNMVSSSYQL